MKNKLIDPNFVLEVQAGKHVFGSPDSYIKEKIKRLDKEIMASEAIKAGEFFMQNKELRSQLAEYKAKRIALEAAGDYFLGLMNKCNEEPWTNAILFCNIAFNYTPPKEDTSSDDGLQPGGESSFINNDELSSLMGKHVDDDNGSDGDEVIFDFAFQTRYGTYIININTAKTSDKLPLFVMDDYVDTPKAPLFELSQRSDEFGFEYVLYDIIYNKTGALILKNDIWKKARSRLIHIKDFKKDMEEFSKREPLSNVERYRQLDFLYKHYVHQEESEFTKAINKRLKNGG